MPPFFQRTTTIIIAALLFLLQNEIKAQDLSYLEGMPTPQQVLDKLDDPDPMHAAAKKVAALQNQLPLIIETIANDRGVSERENRLINEYKLAAGDFRKQYEKDPAHSRKDKSTFNQLCNKYGNSGNLQDDILSGLVSADVRKKFNDKINESVAQSQSPSKSGKSKTPVFVIVLGIAMIITAYVIKFQLNKYEFNNRTSGCVIQFPTHGASVWHSTKHGIAKILYGLGLIVMVLGIIMYFA